jgi:hypothetical protein
VGEGAKMMDTPEKEFVHFVTNRTEHEIFFLNPT